MKAQLKAELLAVGMALGVLSAGAQIRKASASNEPDRNTTRPGLAANPVASEQGQEPSRLNSPPNRAVIDEILKLSDAGVSKDIIKAYIDTASFRYTPKAEDLIELKRHAIPDDLTLTLLKRSADSPKQAATRALSPSPGPQTAGVFSSPMLDPESYGYFQYYYLFPRTLSAANERLGIYPAPGFNGSYPPYWSIPQGPRRTY